MLVTFYVLTCARSFPSSRKKGKLFQWGVIYAEVFV